MFITTARNIVSVFSIHYPSSVAFHRVLELRKAEWNRQISNGAPNPSSISQPPTWNSIIFPVTSSFAHWTPLHFTWLNDIPDLSMQSRARHQVTHSTTPVSKMDLYAHIHLLA